MTTTDPPQRPPILVVEDDPTLNRLLCAQIGDLGHDVRGVRSRAEALEALSYFAPALAILDMRLPDIDGLTFLPELREYCPVMILTAYGSIDQAVKAVKAGAVEYLVKPIATEGLELALGRFFETAALRRDLAFWQAKAQNSAPPALIGDSPAMSELRRVVGLVAAADAPVLILGENGSGKGAVAEAVHAQSPRANARFLSVDCDAGLEAAELFGTLPSPRGPRREGLIAAAENGTLYLNEVEKLPAALQAQVLRVIEQGSYRPAGSAVTIPCPVRILASSSSNLEEAVQAGEFRAELFYRLAGLTLHVPPLRERAADIPALVEHFLEWRGFQRGVEKRLTRETLAAMQSYDWPGNIRELRNAVERGLIMSAGRAEIVPGDVGLAGRATAAATSGTGAGAGVVLRFAEPPTLDQIRDSYLQLLLDRFGGNRQMLARTLGISERNTYRLLKKRSDEED